MALKDYGGYKLDEAEQDERDLKAGGAAFMKLDVGRNIVRVIPPLPGKKLFNIYYQHFVKKPDGTSVSFACPNRLSKKPCPVCEHSQKLQQSGNKADQKLSEQFWPRKRVLVNVINRADPDKGPVVLGIPKTVHEKLVAIRKNEDAGGDFADPMEGFDICIERVGTGQFDTEYTVIASRKNSPLGPDEELAEEWITEQNDLEPFTQVLTVAQITEMMSLEGGGSHQGISDGEKSKNAGALSPPEDDEFGGDEQNF